jgi:type II secretory pathway predicted ATPase ExeA
MEAYRYFGLTAAPFEGRPEPRFFFRAASHGETLATLQYVIHAGKSCSLVLGESGSGKTLLGRLVAENANRRARLLWVHGYGQPDGQTELTVYPPGTLGATTLTAQGGPTESSLAEWIRTPARLRQPTVVIVDNADALRKHSWDDLLALMTREGRAPKPTSLILLGLPDTLERLANPRFVRLRRRVFRTCHLTRFTQPEVAAYITHRLMLCGGRPELFTPDALESVFRYSLGNPALINQICDNALVDAFSDERQLVDAEHIRASVQAIAGPERPPLVPPDRPVLPSTPPPRPEPAPGQHAPETPPAAEEPVEVDTCVLATLPESIDAPHAEEGAEEENAEYWPAPPAPFAPVAGDEPPDADSCERLVRIATEFQALQREMTLPRRVAAPGMPAFVAPAPPQLPAWDPPLPEVDAAAEQLRERLRAIEGRVTGALSRVREARRLQRTPAPTEADSPTPGADAPPDASES